MEKRSSFWATGAAAFLFLLGSAAVAGEKAAEKAAKDTADEKIVLTGPVVIKMEEVMTGTRQKDGEATHVIYPGGQFARCTDKPSKEVKAYPSLHSKRPRYGSVALGSSRFDREAGKKYYFVLDESEPREAESKEQEGRKASYDRLYFDANSDLDLTNDRVLRLAEKPPFGDASVASPGIRFFEDLTIEFDYGPGLGKRPFVVVPGASPDAVLLMPRVVRRGTLKLGAREYVVYLKQSGSVTGRFDHPFVRMEMWSTSGEGRSPRALPFDYLGSMPILGDRRWQLSATPLGDRLTIEPYRGDEGVLAIGPGGRTITNLGCVGFLVSSRSVVPVGTTDPMGRQILPETLPRRHKMPVGDYAIGSLTVDYGRIRFSCRPIVDFAASREDRPPAPLEYGLKIRKEKPSVLEFSGKPSVVFLDPPKGKIFKPGDTVLIRVMLTEPSNRIMITGLEDLRTITGDFATAETGEKLYRHPSLDPTVTIRNARNEEVEEPGKMPFG